MVLVLLLVVVLVAFMQSGARSWQSSSLQPVTKRPLHMKEAHHEARVPSVEKVSGPLQYVQLQWVDGFPRDCADNSSAGHQCKADTQVLLFSGLSGRPTSTGPLNSEGVTADHNCVLSACACACVRVCVCVCVCLCVRACVHASVRACLWHIKVTEQIG